MKLDHPTLRAIGQDLGTIGVSDFDLELEGRDVWFVEWWLRLLRRSLHPRPVD